MFTRRILALAAVLVAALTTGGIPVASAATVAAPAYHQTASTAYPCPPHHWCR